MEGYLLSNHEQLPEITVLWIHAHGTGRRLYLPEDDLAHEIVRAVAERVPFVEEFPYSLRRIELSKGQYVYMCLFTFVYSILAAWYFNYNYVVLHEGRHFWLFLPLVIAFGPGTLGLLALFGKRLVKNNYLRACALIFNMTALSLSMLFSLVHLFYYFSKQIEQA
jgi:hypothetical protein